MENLKREDKGNGLCLVTINRPEKLNALNHETMEEIRATFTALASDETVKAVILTGAGDKAFVAGADINELVERTPIDGKEFSIWGQQVLNRIENLGKPVIAAVNGYALGGGMELAMACTMRVASDRAQFGQPEVLLGIIPGYAGTQRLPRLVGKGRALELILTGDRISADEAHRIGLVNKVVPADELLPTCEKMARAIMSRGPLAVRMGIEAVNGGLEAGFAEGSRLEASLFGLLASSEDMKEGTRAFIEKRKAEFKGR